MLARALAAGVLLAAALLQAAAPRAGTLLERAFHSQALGREYRYRVYLPDGYETQALRYPVLYLLHGATGSARSWASAGRADSTADALIEAGTVPPTLLVMPEHTAGWWVDGARENAEKAFMRELLPEVAARFRVLDARAGRAVAGYSAGGYGTVRFALRYPRHFAAAAALSPAVYAGEPPRNSSARRQHPFLGDDGRFSPAHWEARNYPALLEGYLAQPLRVPLLIHCGDHDRFGLAYEAARLFSALHPQQPGLVELRIVDGDHDWQVWRPALGEAMRYMYRFVSGPRPREPAGSARSTARGAPASIASPVAGSAPETR